jgi:hypothetical protein
MVTKRQLGLFFVVSGAVGVLALLLVDAIGAGNFAGIGPLQRLAFAGAGALILVGVPLIPLGSRPA